MEDTSARRNDSVVSAAAAQVIANDRKRKAIDDHTVTGAGEITVRQSIVPVSLVTVLFFMWGFAYGLLGTSKCAILSISVLEANPSGSSSGAQLLYPLNLSMKLHTDFSNRRLERTLSDCLEYQSGNVWRSASCILRCLFHRSLDIFRMDCSPFWI
jgi:hypothetical protein